MATTDKNNSLIFKFYKICAHQPAKLHMLFLFFTTKYKISWINTKINFQKCYFYSPLNKCSTAGKKNYIHFLLLRLATPIGPAAFRRIHDPILVISRGARRSFPTRQPHTSCGGRRGHPRNGRRRFRLLFHLFLLISL